MDKLYDHYQHCWNYFALHANQRMHAFNYFILMQSAIFAGIFILHENKDRDLYLINIATTIVLVISFVFWQIDLRTRSLIKAAEEEMIKIENSHCRENQKGPFSKNGVYQKFSVMRYSHCISSIYLLYLFSSVLLLVINLGVFESLINFSCRNLLP